MESVNAMSFGKMNQRIEILAPTTITDSEGFQSKQLAVVASVRAFREGRHGSSAWANRATFTKASNLFRIRKPATAIDETMLIRTADGELFEIDSVEDVRGRGRYLEILASSTHAEGS